jgi:isoquinoline 1-oxidoreductase beta subunit
MTTGSVSRRTFLKVSAAAGGGLLVSFALPAKRRGGRPGAAAAAAPFTPNGFIRVERDGRLTLVMHQVEMGQGTYTSMPMLIAEELEVERSQVHLEHAPPDDALYANPLIGFQMTGSSTSVRTAWTPLRRAGATARVMLVSAAAQTWQVDATACRAEKGTVIHVPTGRALAYGALVDAAAILPVPATVVLKGPADFKLIGTPAKRLDTPDKVNGRAQYSIDVAMSGMRIATVATCPVFSGTLASVDDSKAKAVPGVHQVVRLDNAVAVVGAHMWAAKQGLAALSIQWNEGPYAGLSTPDVVRQLEAASQISGVVARKTGDVAGVMASAATKIEAVYQLPFLAHATMEPVNCTVHVRPDACDVWVGTQVVSRAQVRSCTNAHGGRSAHCAATEGSRGVQRLWHTHS